MSNPELKDNADTVVSEGTGVTTSSGVATAPITTITAGTEKGAKVIGCIMAGGFRRRPSLQEPSSVAVSTIPVTAPHMKAGVMIAIARIEARTIPFSPTAVVHVNHVTHRKAKRAVLVATLN